ncbi:MFS transporter, MCP family, solute carrier family 16 (monocarboxylic acid transporters), member 7 [Mytilus galloprovincialis]|uniref:MFS transporter, MCP family, solute carrier family 16 (Monocarboxylic acid transporters), member 7 n=1 Tax=Mytilus galloprovincialis TaxID=29158 RepID=A0A8B6FFZ6_MYTGA|nr:MFS transporter, MCP family, solute carrier family 16 (monocarboxylic acid transporters), member 7 [Mytilus galloprovincialis]
MAEQTGVPYDRGWAWMIVVGYFFSSFIMLGVAKSYGILMKPLIDEFNVDITIASLGNAVMAGIYTLGGIGNSCLYGNGVVMIGSYFKRIRTVANGVALSGASVGTFVIPPLIEFLLQTYGLPGTYLILGGLYLTIAVCGALYRPLTFYASERQGGENDEKHQLVTKDMNEYFTSTGSLVIGSMESLSQIVQADESKKLSNSITIEICGKAIVIPKIFHFSVLKMPEVVFYTIFSFLVFFGYFNFIILMPLDAASKGFASYEKAWLVSCAGIGDLLGRVVIGIVGDLRIIERYKIIGATCICCGINILIFNFATVFWWCAIHTTLYGFFGGAYVALNSIVLIDMVGLEIMPKAIGVILLIQGLGAIKGASGSFSLLNYINSSLMIIGGFFMFLYPFVRDHAKKSKDKNDVEQEEEDQA